MSDTLINKSNVRKYAESVMLQERPHLAAKMTRIAGSFFERVDGRVREAIRQEIRGASTNGKTLT